MIEFNKIQKSTGLGKSQAKKVEEKAKVEEKNVEASSSEALNSYGRAFVNLSFKGNIKGTEQIKSLSEAEQEEIIQKLKEFAAPYGTEEEIEGFLEEIIPKNKEAKNIQLSFIKDFMDEPDINIVSSIFPNTVSEDKEILQGKIALARELLNKKVNTEDIENLLVKTNSNDKEIQLNQINFARELLDKGVNETNITNILLNTKSDNKEIQQKQINLARELFNKGIGEDIIESILHGACSLDDENQEKQINLARELLNKGISTEGIKGILYNIISDDKEIQEEQEIFARELLDKGVNGEDIGYILSGTKSDDKEIQEEQEIFARELLDKGVNGEDIGRILNGTNCDVESTRKKQIDFAKELFDKEVNGKDIGYILSGTKSNYIEIQKDLIDFAKELFDKEVNGKDIGRILQYTNSGYETAILSKIPDVRNQEKFLIELLDKEVNGENIGRILQYTKSDDKEIQEEQEIFARELLDKGVNGKNIGRILQYTKSNDIEIQKDLIAFAKELLDKGVNGENIGRILQYTKSNDIEIQNKQIAFAKELLDKEVNGENIGYILSGTKSDDKKVQEEQEIFARELLDKGVNGENIEYILFGTNSNNIENQKDIIAFAKELLDKGVNGKYIGEILNYTKSDDIEIQKNLIAFAKELLDKGFNSEDFRCIIFDIIASSNIEDQKAKISDARKIIADVNDTDGLTARQAVAISTNKNIISTEDIKKLQKRMGYKNAARLNINDTLIAAKLIGLCNATDINQISLEDKKEVIRKLVECNSGCFEASDKLKQFFPLIPTNQEEYCALLPSLVKALGIETKELKEDEIKEFSSSLNSLGENLAKLSDEDFSNLQISQEYSTEDFIKDAFDIIKDLPIAERQKVYDYFGFELHKNPNDTKVSDKLNFSIVGYPANLNNGKKLAKIEDVKTKEVVEKLRPYVIKYSENNKIKTNNDDITSAMNAVVKYLPEFRTSINKTQHDTHDYTIGVHSLKVMQKIVQNPEFEKLNDSDKKLMLLASLLHDLSKTEGKKDALHATNSAFDAYYISKKFNLTRDEEIKLYSLIKNHEWLGYVNKNNLFGDEKLKRQQSVAFDLQYDNLFEMSKILTSADLKGVQDKDEFYNKFEKDFKQNCAKIDSLISELKTTQPLFPTTKIPNSETIKKAITTVNSDGSTNLKGIYQDENGLIVVKFNEVENSTWEKIGFDKNTISRGIQTKTSAGDEVDTGNIHFFVHGLDYENQLSKFNAFSLPDSDALLSVSYVERPESKTRFFRTQGVILNTKTKYTYGGGETDSGSGCGKNIENFKQNYIFGGEREYNRKYIPDLIKTTLNLNDEEYLKFVQENKDKSFGEIEPTETREKLIKAFAGINSNTRRGNREYNEMYISNPEIMGVFAYPDNENDEIGDTMEFVKKQKDFLKKYAIEHNVPMFVFGK